VLFLALTLGLSLLVFWGPLALFQIPTIGLSTDTRGPVWAIVLFMIGGFTPSLVAIGLTWAREGGAAVRRLLRRVVQVRIGWRWYVIMLGIVVLATAGQILIMRALGQRFEVLRFVTNIATLLPLIVLGPVSEEIGWRGYALDRLQMRLSPLATSVLIGVVWGLWHLPLFFIPGSTQAESNFPFTGFLVGVTALSILFTWAHNNTGGSIWTAVFFHWIYTYSLEVTGTGVVRSPVYNWLEYSPFVLIAIIVTAFTLAKGPRVERLRSGEAEV
jgi:hypothetical protein